MKEKKRIAVIDSKGAPSNVAAVVVTYNRRDLVKECIEAILKQQNATCDIIVIDNGSRDGTEELFKTTFKDAPIDYENVGENLGCAESTARLVKKATELGYKRIWVMDDDVVPEPDALYNLLQADKKLKGNWGILSGAAYWKDGSICEANRQKKTIFTFMKDSDYDKPLIKVRMVSLASMYINAEAVKKVGTLKGEYFIYSEDYDFCARVGKHYPIYVVPKSRVVHKMRENRKVNFVKEPADRLYRYKYLYRNDVDCYRQLGIAGWSYLAIKFIYTALQLVVFENGNRVEKLKILFNGYKEGLLFWPAVVYPEFHQVCST